MNGAQPGSATSLGGEHRSAARRSDDDLACEACGGDIGAFGKLAARHETRLRRTLYRITKDCEMAKDAVQEALIRAWRGVCSFEGRSKFSSWLTRIGMNEAYRELGQRRATLSLDAEGAPSERLTDPGPSLEQIVDSKETLAAIGRALQDLPEDHREAVILRDVEGLSTREAAKAAGIEERALKSRLHRGRRTMHERLYHDLPGTLG